MALLHNMTSPFGMPGTWYVRLNDVSTDGKPHNSPTVTAYARFRVYYWDGESPGPQFVWEVVHEFQHDVSQPLWPSAYASLVATPEWESAVNYDSDN